MNQIGPHTFDRLTRPPHEVYGHVAIEARAGVDGQTAWQTGERGEPYEVVSTQYAGSVSEADGLVDSYQELIGEIVSVTWLGLPRTDRVLVQNVVPAPQGVKAVLAVYGSLAAIPYQARCTCVWTLLPWREM